MGIHVHVLLVTLARGAGLILTSVLQLLVFMETALYAILHMMLSSFVTFSSSCRIYSMATGVPVIMDGVERTVILTLMTVIPTLVSIEGIAL